MSSGKRAAFTWTRTSAAGNPAASAALTPLAPPLKLVAASAVSTDYGGSGGGGGSSGGGGGDGGEGGGGASAAQTIPSWILEPIIAARQKLPDIGLTGGLTGASGWRRPLRRTAI